MKFKASGVDNLSIKVLKVIINNIAESLTHIFNLSIYQGIWPDILKKAEEVPIYKAEDKWKKENYRLASLISDIAKMFEKIIYKKIYQFLTEIGILSNNRYGFMRNIDTEEVLGKLTSMLHKNIGKGIYLIYFD